MTEQVKRLPLYTIVFKCGCEYQRRMTPNQIKYHKARGAKIYKGSKSV